MTATLIGLLFLTSLFWIFLRLRDLREADLEDELPGDKITVLLGIFMILSKACLQYHRDRGEYPTLVSGSEDALMDAGYLDGEPLAKMTKSIPVFSIVSTEAAGSAVCLANTPASLAAEISGRVGEMGGGFIFFDLRSGQFVPLEGGVQHETVTLCLMLPEEPLELPEPPEGA